MTKLIAETSEECKDIPIIRIMEDINEIFFNGDQYYRVLTAQTYEGNIQSFFTTVCAGECREDIKFKVLIIEESAHVLAVE